MNPGQEWHRSFHRLLASPTIEVLAVVAVLALALFSMADADALYPAQGAMVVLGPR
jgi:hypothetical protein